MADTLILIILDLMMKWKQMKSKLDLQGSVQPGSNRTGETGRVMLAVLCAAQSTCREEAPPPAGSNWNCFILVTMETQTVRLLVLQFWDVKSSAERRSQQDHQAFVKRADANERRPPVCPVSVRSVRSVWSLFSLSGLCPVCPLSSCLFRLRSPFGSPSRPHGL